MKMYYCIDSFRSSSSDLVFFFDLSNWAAISNMKEWSSKLYFPSASTFSYPLNVSSNKVFIDESFSGSCSFEANKFRASCFEESKVIFISSGVFHSIRLLIVGAICLKDSCSIDLFTFCKSLELGVSISC